jgi:hypothetical protein
MVVVITTVNIASLRFSEPHLGQFIAEPTPINQVNNLYNIYPRASTTTPSKLKLFKEALKQSIDWRDATVEKNGVLCALPVGGECGFRIDSLI